MKIQKGGVTAPPFHYQNKKWKYLSRTVWHSLALLISAICLVTINATPAFAALSVAEYFTYTYQIELSKTSISGNEVFYVTVNAEVECKKDLPSGISEARVVGRVVAQHQTTGVEVELNPEYKLEITEFPTTAGETFTDTVVVSLSFPDNSQSGTYSIVGQLIKAEIKFVIWWDVTSQFPSTQPMGTVTYEAPGGSSGSSGGGGGGGGGSAEEPDDDLSDFIDDSGKFTEEVTVESTDSKVELTIAEGTTGLTAEEQPLSQITITEMEEPPAPPEYHGGIGLTYQLEPDGATFNPPITIAFAYGDSLIPAGAAEEKLALALWDSVASQWVKLDSAVDTANNLISARISHFTPFAILVPTHPADFVVSELSITPDKVYVGENVTISFLVTNAGDLEDTCEVTPQINNVELETREVTLAGGASETLTFTVSRDTIGTYTVIIDGIYARFVVKEPLPADFTITILSINPIQADIGEEVTVSVRVTNTGDLEGTYAIDLVVDGEVVHTKMVTLDGGNSVTVPLTVSVNNPGTYTISVNGAVGKFTVKGPSVPPEPKPALLTASNLTISPAEVEIGETVTISVMVTNIGDLSGSYEAVFKIDDTVVATEDVTLDGRASRQVTFTISRNTAATYAISVNDLQGTLVVNAPPPIVKPSHWWLTATIIAGIIIAASTIWILVRRRRA